jgi:hypothetical protein
MKTNLWDILSVLVITCTLVVLMVVLIIFVNPRSSINPFPPPTSVPTIDIPTSTPTLVRLPPTWTPTPSSIPTQRPTNTPMPVATQLIINP